MSTLSKALNLGDRNVVAFAGGGGKTTLMLRLALELHARGRRVAVTTTTKMRAGERTENARAIFSGKHSDLALGMDEAFASGTVPFLFSRREGGKHVGLPPDTVDVLANHCDVLLVETDGSKGKPVKIPRAHDPVVPDSADRYVIVLGAEALGKPVEEAVFPPSAASDELGDPGPLTPEAIAILMHHADGFLRLTRPGRETSILVNHADAVTNDRLASLARALGHGAVHRIVVGSAHSPSTPFTVHDNRDHWIAAVVLAAGSSERFGRPKQLAEFQGRSLLHRALETARRAGVERTFVVLGHEMEKVRAVVDPGDDLEIVANPRYGEGLSESIRRGLEAAGEFDGALLVLGDLPFLGVDLARAVVEAYRSSTAPLSFPVVEGRPGHPILFRKDLWGALREVQGDEGGRSVVEKHAQRAAAFPWGDRRTQRDIDTEGDYAILR
ncbi:MAG: selenium cofactor biosynthesis protein YqeC [Planctomycetota bacterium]|jgi:molybdenum cofactor cytidylyltransferase